jgi:hypothetical protein
MLLPTRKPLLKAESSGKESSPICFYVKIYSQIDMNECQLRTLQDADLRLM